MAAIEEALRTYLLTVTALTNLVSTRILPDDISDEAALPAVIYSKVSDIKSHYLTGQNTMERPVFQYSVYCVSKSGARAITDQLKTALKDYHGTLSSVVIQKIELQSEYSSLQTTDDGSQRVYIEDLEFEVTYLKE